MLECVKFLKVKKFRKYFLLSSLRFLTILFCTTNLYFRKNRTDDCLDELWKQEKPNDSKNRVYGVVRRLASWDRTLAGWWWKKSGGIRDFYHWRWCYLMKLFIFVIYHSLHTFLSVCLLFLLWDFLWTCIQNIDQKSELNAQGRKQDMKSKIKEGCE